MNYEHFAHPDTKKDIFLVDMNREKWYFSELMSRAIERSLKEKKKVLIIVNKKGYASWLLCQSCGHIPQCSHCDVSIGYHDMSIDHKTKQDTKLPTNQNTKLLIGLCHICKTVYPLPSACPVCHKSETLVLYGLTLQKTAERIEQYYHIKPAIIDASSLSSSKKIEKSLTEITNAPIVVATSAIQSAECRVQNIELPVLNSPFWILNFWLIILPSADQWLTLPDYAVREKNFVMLYDIFTHRDTQHYIIQSHKVDHPSIRSACKMDPSGFYTDEWAFRQAHHYPPYGELCIIKYNHHDENRLHNAIETLTKELRFLQQSYGYQQMEIYSTPPLVYKKFGKFYYHIIIVGQQVRLLMDIAFSKLQMAKRGYKIDWMAESML